MARVLIAPTTVEHTRPDLDAAVAQVRHAFAEPTSSTASSPSNAPALSSPRPTHLRRRRFETRILHPFVTKAVSQSAVDPGNKTDDTDLSAIHRATVTGCALMEATRDAADHSATPRPPTPRSRPQRRRSQLPNPRTPRSRPPRLRRLLRQAVESPVPWHLLQHFPHRRPTPGRRTDNPMSVAPSGRHPLPATHVQAVSTGPPRPPPATSRRPTLTHRLGLLPRSTAKNPGNPGT